ncbi:MAG TPA: AI-2E family transporter, partial [Dehalococcoidia bacterium]|nr:AI-2E family transporter [Dehalococcoidia bacterium]
AGAKAMNGPIRGTISAIPAVLVALTMDPTKVILVIVFAVISQQIENHVLVPRVMGHTVGVSPLTVLIGILVGATLYGLPGAFLAVPIAGAVQVILAHVLRSEDSAQGAAHHEIQGRHHGAELDLEDAVLSPDDAPPVPASPPPVRYAESVSADSAHH